MKNTSAIASMILETRKTLSDGTHPVKLRITYKGKRKYYTMNLDPKENLVKSVKQQQRGLLNVLGKKGLTQEDWDNLFVEHPKRAYKVMVETKNKMILDAGNVIKSLHEFSFKAFEELYFKEDAEKEKMTDLFYAMEKTAKELRNEGRIKTAITYETALKSLRKFHKKDNLPFDQVTQEWLKRYEKWMLEQGNISSHNTKKKQANSPTTIGIYLRNVRATFNRTGITENYPFGKGKYVIPKGRNVKKALTLKEIALIYRYDAIPGSVREKARDFWMLSYLCNGANIKDIVKLKFNNIDSERITFVRSKTSGTISKSIIVPLTIDISKILDKYSISPSKPDDYVLPILNKEMSEKEKQLAIDSTVRMINEHIKIIASNCGIGANISTYTARHSFATVLKRSGASVEFISEALGHQSLLTTENYLADFEIDKKKEMAAMLTNWSGL